jgi:hypothetical protein
MEGIVAITLDTADQLDALGDQLSAVTGPDPALDAQLYNLILEPMQVIQGRTPAAGFKYTLNVTNALQLRAKGWYMRGLLEIGQSNAPFAGCGFEHIVDGNVVDGTSGQGASIGLAACAGIAHCWAKIIRTYLAAPAA